jgi:hypothetical protein
LRDTGKLVAQNGGENGKLVPQNGGETGNLFTQNGGDTGKLVAQKRVLGVSDFMVEIFFFSRNSPQIDRSVR